MLAYRAKPLKKTPINYRATSDRSADAFLTRRARRGNLSRRG